MTAILKTEKLATMLKAKRGSTPLRNVAQEIGGVSAPTLSRIEQGNIPDIETFLKICAWLEVSPEFFTSVQTSDTAEQKVVAQLRADKTLPKDTAEALIKMINLAYEQFKSK